MHGTHGCSHVAVVAIVYVTVTFLWHLPEIESVLKLEPTTRVTSLCVFLFKNKKKEKEKSLKEFGVA